MQVRSRRKNFYIRYGLAVCGVFWLTFTKFRKVETLKHRYGRTPAPMSLTMCKRLARGSAVLPGRNQQIFLSQGVNPLSSESYEGRWRHNPRGSFLLFLANSFKVAGMFDVASITYQMALHTGYKRDLTHTGLADLYIIEAGWTVEAEAHFDAGILLDERLAPCLRLRSRAWTHRGFAEAIEQLQKAIDINAENKSAWWLLSETLLKIGQWEHGLNALRSYLLLAPALYEQNMAAAIGEFGLSPAKGKLILDQKMDRWKGWLKSSVVQVADQFGAREISGIQLTKLADSTTLRLASHVVAGGELSYYERDVVFDKVNSYKVQEVEVLPSYGTSIAMGKYLLADTTHVSPIHWHRYTPSLLAMTNNDILICRDSPRDIDIEDAIYFGHNENYYHFICEDLPRLLLLEDRGCLSGRSLLVSLGIKSWQQQVLIRFGFPPSRWRAVDFSAPLRFRNLNIPAVVSRNLLANPVAINLIRKRLNKQGDEGAKVGKRLYLMRGTGGSRNARFLNEEAVMRRLKSVGFTPVSTGSMSIDAQIELFSDAEVIAGPAGAAFTNLVFAPRSCKALLFGSSADAGEAFSSLAAASGQDYFICLGDGFPQPHASWIHTSFDFKIDLRDLDLALESIQQKRCGA